MLFYDFTKILFSAYYKIFFRLEVKGIENIPLQGSVVIASNHISLLDPPTIGVACKTRYLNFMAKIELFKNPIFAYLIRNLGAFPVKRGEVDKNAIKKALDVLRAGKVLCIFPEGTRGKNGVLGKAEPGSVALACKTNAIIIPTALYGTDKLSITNPFPKIKVIFGEPMQMTQDMGGKDVLEENAGKVMREIEKLLLELRKKD